MNEGLHINGITLGANWDAESALQKDISIGFDDTKLMGGSTSSSPGSDNNQSSVSTMLESLRSNLSQIYSGETQESSAYSMSVKSESPIRGNDFCSNDENTFNHQHSRGPHNSNNENSAPSPSQQSSVQNSGFENIYSSVITSSSSMQRQFSSGSGHYDGSPTNNNPLLNNALFSQQAQQGGYPTYPLPVKPEPSSPNTPYNLNPYYLGNGPQGLYPPVSMSSLNQIDYQGYRLSDMMLPTFATQDQLIKQEKYPSLGSNSADGSESVLSHPLLGGLNGPLDTDNLKLEQYANTEVTGPMRIRRIKRPIPAGPSYPVHLWQFILELLGDHSCKDFIAWTGNDLEFKVINSRELARRWGRRKNNARMNFDKLSRAMRYYYEKNIIKHIPGQRLVYRYCRNPDDIVFTQLLKTAMGTLPPDTRLIAPVTTNPAFSNTHSLQQGFNPRAPALSFPPNTCSQSHLGPHHHQQHHQGASSPPLSASSPLGGGLPGMQPSATNLLSGAPTTLATSALGSGLATSGLLVNGRTDNGLLGNGRDGIPEYMFSANCLTQVQQHLQSGEGVKQHHMMAS